MFWSLKTSVGCRTPQLSSKMFLTCSATSNWVVTTRVYIERLNFRSLLWFWKRGSILSLLSLFKVDSPPPSFQSHMRFWASWPKTRILGFRPNEYEQILTFFFGKSLEVSGGIGNIIRPISGRSAEISTRTWWWPTSQKSKKCDFFRFSQNLS